MTEFCVLCYQHNIQRKCTLKYDNEYHMFDAFSEFSANVKLTDSFSSKYELSVL